MAKNIEVEVRGPINKLEVLKLEKKLKFKGKSKGLKHRVLIDYSTFLPKQGIANRTKDIRLRVTNGIPEIIVKLGKWGAGENRKEISVLSRPGEFDKLVQIFAIIGLTKGALCVRKSRIYEYRGVEFSIVEVPGHSYYFEAEKLISNKESSATARRYIESVCRELNLRLFDKKSFFQYIERLNKEANEEFNFKNYSEGYFKKRFRV